MRFREGENMPLRESKGNMYGFITHTWNPIKGKCPHDCEYCYMKRWGEQPELRFDWQELKTDLGSGNIIFIGSSCDMWAELVPSEWISEILNICLLNDRNIYFFQSKNPQRFLEFPFPDKTIFCTTIETNRDYKQMRTIPDGILPSPHDRAFPLSDMLSYKRMVTIEPIMDFDTPELIYLLKITDPYQVNIGADSQGHNLPEPSGYKIQRLIEYLESFTKVYLKPNLKRLME